MIAEGKALNVEITRLEEEVRELQEQYQEAMLKIPNFLPLIRLMGESDADNVVIKTHLTPRKFDFIPKDHVEIGKHLDLIDFEAGAKVTGAKFYFLKNEAVLLELGLKLLAMQIARNRVMSA